ncbi:MAG: CRISPR-associated endonuclease Cas2 [Saprospiraceae bacterium]|nr:CRISPR-associated endonuclease Cas2 [Saprospiraceae bacterium]
MAKRPRKPDISFPERLRRLREAGLRTERLQGYLPERHRQLPDLEERVRSIEHFLRHANETNNNTMLFFIMYDIEDHKVRRHLAKYLSKNGCMRMQKSVFIGSTEHKRYREIAQTLEEVNSMYENGDSILILPVTRESMVQLNVIGKDLNYKMVTTPPNVLII